LSIAAGRLKRWLWKGWREGYLHKTTSTKTSGSDGRDRLKKISPRTRVSVGRRRLMKRRTAKGKAPASVKKNRNSRREQGEQ